jgi:5-methylcytosine-specific restriction endonuclease McrA
MIESGELHLTGASRVAPQLTPENADELLDSVVHKTKREIEEILVHWNPQEDVPDSMMPIDGDHPSITTPLSPGRFSLCFTATGRCVDLIGEARALSSHPAPRAGLGEIIEAALEAYVEKLEKQRFKTTDRPQTPREEPSEDPRHIPARVMREVYQRDGGRCTYVGTHGHRCRARAYLEFDHVDPVALGGKGTADKLRLRCRAHNQLAAREVFGDQHVSLRASGFRPVGLRDQLVPARAREAFEIWDRFLAPPGEPSLLGAIRKRRAESTSVRDP